MRDPNLQLLEQAARLLQQRLLDDVVFVGGCVTGLLITDPAAAGMRPTTDVDVILEAPHDVRSYIREALAKLLGTRGFIDALLGFLLPDEANQARLAVLQERLEVLAS